MKKIYKKTGITILLGLFFLIFSTNFTLANYKTYASRAIKRAIGHKRALAKYANLKENRKIYKSACAYIRIAKNIYLRKNYKSALFWANKAISNFSRVKKYSAKYKKKAARIIRTATFLRKLKAKYYRHSRKNRLNYFHGKKLLRKAGKLYRYKRYKPAYKMAKKSIKVLLRVRKPRLRRR